MFHHKKTVACLQSDYKDKETINIKNKLCFFNKQFFKPNRFQRNDSFNKYENITSYFIYLPSIKFFMNKLYICLVVCFLTFTANAQQWVDVWQDENTTMEQKQAAFNAFFAGKDISQIKGWKGFKRWEYFYQRRMLQGEDVQAVKQKTLQYFLQNSNGYLLHTTNTLSPNGNWSFIGPSLTPTNGGGAGRVNCVEFDNAINPYVGAPAGGLWKRTGVNWGTNTDNLSYLGVSDILINPSNNNEMYAATGDADAGDAPCIGVIKSTDGGLNWVSAGMTNAGRIYKIMPFGNNYNQLICATNLGIYTTTNGGTTWTGALTGVGTVYDIEFKPNSITTIYAVTANGYFISTNGGTSFTNITTTAGLPTTGNNRRAITVTPANDNYVYLLASRSDNSGFHSFWKSTDGGNSFVKMRDGVTGTLNLLGWNASGTDISAGGQGWYDLAIAAHPTDPETVYTGGVNIWRTNDGGANWTINGHWTGSGGAPYVHADIHSLDFRPNGDLYCGSDGGLFKNTNTLGAPNWTDESNGLQIAQMYRLGISQTNDGLVLTGWQDNGTNLRNSSVSNWRRVIGGDGFESAIDPSNANIMLGELYYGAISKSTNGGTSFSGMTSSSGAAGTVNEQGPWLTNYVIAKSNTSVYYVGKSNIYRSATAGTTGSFVPATGIPSAGSIYALAVAPTNENVVYASKGGAMYVSTNGTTFTNVGNGLPGSQITYIAVGSNPNTAFATVNGSTGNKVYRTTDAGQNWTNITGNLPNIAPQCLAVDESKPHNQLYVGHLNGVYYKNDTLPNWVVFDNNLPNTEVSELEIMYSANKIKASTYGRGAWESDLFTNGVAAPCTAVPVANFSSNVVEVCPGNAVNFINSTTTCTGSATYLWTFAGGTPATSTTFNQSVVYNTPGTYTVTLVATNVNGSNTRTITNLILVKPTVTQSATITADKLNICSNESVTFSLTGTNNGTAPNISWFRNGQLQGSGPAIQLNGFNSGDVVNATVQVGTTTLCVSNNIITTNNLTINVTPQPAKPTITQIAGDLISSSATGNQWFNNGTAITGATARVYHPIVNGLYSVQVNQNGCISPMSDPINLKIEGINNIYPVPNDGNMNFDIYAPPGVTNYSASLFSSVGELVKQDVQTVAPGLNRINIKWKGLASGVYNLKVMVGTQTYTKRIIIRQ